MASLSKSFCVSLFPAKGMRLRSLGRLKSASGVVAASATMLSSMCGISAQLHVSSSASVAATAQRLRGERVRSEMASVIREASFSGACCPGLTSTSAAGGRLADLVTAKVENAKHVCRGFQLLASSRCYAVQSDASAVYSTGATSSPSSSVSTGVLAGRAVVEPSPIIGEEYYADELVARDAVLNYLKSQAIETAELEAVALPPSVAVMAERMAFLRKIGLSVQDINDYPLMVGCSVKKNLVPVLSYLEKLNVEAKYLPDLIRKYPMVLNSSVEMDLDPVVSFLMGIGIERLYLGRVLTRYPDILGFKIEGTMSTSVAYLVSLGVNMREIGPMITEYPEILGMRVGNNIKPKVDYLLGRGIPKEVLAKLLEVKPFILGFDLEDKMKPAIHDLIDVGVREDQVANVLIQYADVLGLNIKHRLESKMGWLIKQAGVKREDIGQVLEKLPQILAINIALAQSRVTFLSSGGFSIQDLGIMVTKCPQILALSVDDVLKPHLSFFVKSMKRPLSELVNYPFYFTYNLENRIRPRYIQIERKGIQCSLAWFLNCTDAKFENRLQLEFVERPDEEEADPLASMGGRLRIKGEDLSNEASDEESNVAAES